MPQDGEKDGRVENEDTHVSHEQMVVQAQDVDAPQPPPQVVNRRNTPLLQDHPQDLIVGILIQPDFGKAQFESGNEHLESTMGFFSLETFSISGCTKFLDFFAAVQLGWRVYCF